MDYEKKYKEALERARKCLDEKQDRCFVRPDVIFPELKESEDERIRKALIEYFNEQCDMSDWNGVYGYQVVAWLEKQKPTNSIIHFKADNFHVSHVDGKIHDATYVENKQKPIKWSNEDKLGLENTIALIQGYKDCYEEEAFCVDNCDYCLNWLNSLKERILSKTNE